MLGGQVELMLHRLGRRLHHVGIGTHEEGDEQPAGKEEADKECADAYHACLPPYSAGTAAVSPSALAYLASTASVIELGSGSGFSKRAIIGRMIRKCAK